MAYPWQRSADETAWESALFVGVQARPRPAVPGGDGSAAALAQEHGLSSPKLLQTWVRAYRNGGVDALRPKPKGRPAKDDDGTPPREPSEVEQLRQENERLRAENAYLKKVRALRAQGRQ